MTSLTSNYNKNIADEYSSNINQRCYYTADIIYGSQIHPPQAHGQSQPAHHQQSLQQPIQLISPVSIPQPQQFYYQQPNPSQHYFWYTQQPHSSSQSQIIIPTARRKSKQSTTWSPKEDKLLRELKEVQKLGWREISTFFDDRTPNACQFRWRRIISGTASLSSINGLATNLKTNKKSHHSINFLLN